MKHCSFCGGRKGIEVDELYARASADKGAMICRECIMDLYDDVILDVTGERAEQGRRNVEGQ